MRKIYWILLLIPAILTYPLPIFPTTILILLIISKIIGKERTDKIIKKLKKIIKKLKQKWRKIKNENKRHAKIKKSIR